MPREPRMQPGTVTVDGAEEPFVGRRRELKALAVSLEAAQSGKGRLDIVSGVPGIGKTRLAREIARAASQRGLRVLRGGCWEGGGAPAYWPWADILRSALDTVADGRASSAADFAFLLDAAAARARIPLASPVDVSHDAQQARFVLFDRFCEFLAATAAAQATLVVIDDVQWADAGSLLLLQFLAARLADQPLALLITSREPLSDMIAAVTRHAWARHLVLSGLSRAEAGALIEARTARRPAREVLHRLMQLTEGNPYFLRELGSQLVDGTPDFDPTGSIALPTSLVIAALQPYHRLPPGCRTLLQAAAVIGREFGADLAASAAAVTDREALALLDQAVERRVIVGMGTGRYRFAHALVREAIREELHLSERTHLHEQIALALERHLAAGETVSSATLAHHFSMGLPFTDRLRAASHSLAAGQEAHRACAFEEAVFQLRRARELSGPALSDSECCDVMLLLGAAEAGAGEWARSRRTFEDAAALARRIESPDRFARAALGFKGMMLGTIPVDVEAVALLREALERIDGAYPALRVELYAALSTALYFSHKQHLTAHYSDIATACARALEDDRLTAIALEARLLANLRPETGHLVRHDAEHLLRLGERLHSPITRFYARVSRYWHLVTYGHPQEAAKELHRARELASASNHPRSAWLAVLLRASQALARGQWKVASNLTAHASELGRRIHDSGPMQHSLVQSFQQARFTKHYQKLQAATAQSVDRYPDAVGYLAAEAWLHAALQQPEEAQSRLAFFTRASFDNIRSDFFTLYTLCLLAETAAQCEAVEAAKILYQKLRPYAQLFVVAGWGTVIDGCVAHYLALLSACFGSIEDTCSLFELALDANSRLDYLPLVARTELAFAQFLKHRARQDPARTNALASAAARKFSLLGLDHLRIQAERVLQTDTVPQDRRTIPSDVQNAMFRTGQYWVVRFQGHTAHIRHLIGLSYIATLISSPESTFHALDLVSTVAGSPIRPPVEPASGFDSTAKQAYKAQLRFLDREIAIATDHNDIGKLEGLHRERDGIVRELARVYGLFDRRRPLGSAAERARISVKNRISCALATLRTCNEPAFQHLSRSIRTGAYCCYSPEYPTEWAVT
jgi:predicted ATPase